MPRKLPDRKFAFRLDEHSGVPVYRQLVDQVRAAAATGSLRRGDQLPTVRQVAVDLAINPNTVMRAYRELELVGFLETQAGTGTFLSDVPVTGDNASRQRQLGNIASEALARCAGLGLGARDLLDHLRELTNEVRERR
jgi:GntR family transcriptional regulator